MANNMCNPQHRNLVFDKQVVDTALLFVDGMVRQPNGESLRRIQDICKELYRHTLTIAHQRENDDTLVTSQFLNESGSSSGFAGYGDAEAFWDYDPMTDSMSLAWEFQGDSANGSTDDWFDSLNFTPNYNFGDQF